MLEGEKGRLFRGGGGKKKGTDMTGGSIIFLEKGRSFLNRGRMAPSRGGSQGGEGARKELEKEVCDPFEISF